MNRQFRRAAGREQSKIQKEFWTVVNKFNQYVDTIPDGVENESYLIKRFNNIWFQFCDHWEKTPHVMKPDRQAFTKYVTGQMEIAVD